MAGWLSCCALEQKGEAAAAAEQKKMADGKKAPIVRGHLFYRVTVKVQDLLCLCISYNSCKCSLGPAMKYCSMLGQR